MIKLLSLLVTLRYTKIYRRNRDDDVNDHTLRVRFDLFILPSMIEMMSGTRVHEIYIHTLIQYRFTELTDLYTSPAKTLTW